MERQELSASVVKPRKISNIKHLKALVKPACKLRLQKANKYSALDRKKRSNAPNIPSMRQAWDDISQHNGKSCVTLMRGNTARAVPLLHRGGFRVRLTSPADRCTAAILLSRCCRAACRAFDRDALLTFRIRFRFTACWPLYRHRMNLPDRGKRPRRRRPRSFFYVHRHSATAFSDPVTRMS